MPGKGTVNKTLSPVLFLDWLLFDEVPPVFPTGKLTDPQLAVKVFFNFPPPKLISYFNDTVFPKISELASVQLLLNVPSKAKFLNCFSLFDSITGFSSSEVSSVSSTFNSSSFSFDIKVEIKSSLFINLIFLLNFFTN